MAISELVVFVSHVGEDRPAAQDIVAELERRGIRCWIAPRDLRPGRPYDDEIAEAIYASRAMVLIFSERCNVAEYVRREVVLADDNHKKIIVFRIEDVSPRGGLALRVSHLHRIEGFIDREQKIEELVRELAPQNGRIVDTEAIRVSGIRFVQEKKWTGHDLVEKLEKLDHILIEALTDDDEAAPEVLAPAYIDYPDTWRLLIDHSDKIIGYWRFVPLTEHWYERARSGLLLDKELSVETMRYFGLPGTYDIYVPILGLLPEYRNARGNRLLFKSLLDVLTQLAKADILVGRVCATAFTTSGERLCEELEMKRLRTHTSRGTVFEDSMASMLAGLLRRGSLLKGYKFLVRRYSIS